MQTRHVGPWIALVALCFSGCTNPGNDAQVQELARSLAAANATIAAGNNRIAALESRVKELESNANLQDLVDSLKDVVLLRPGDGGYSVLNFELGKLTASIEDVRPFANGSKVILSFGNPTSATVNRLTMDLEWGTDPAAQFKTKKITFSESLQRGGWTRVPVVLEEVKPTELGFVRIKNVTHGQIELARAKSQ